eukprot:2519939-Pleurochrysis_carterae.AAC.2
MLRAAMLNVTAIFVDAGVRARTGTSNAHARAHAFAYAPLCRYALGPHDSTPARTSTAHQHAC